MASVPADQQEVTIKSLLKVYAEHSTIKFLPRFMKAKTIIHRILWLITFIAGGTMASLLLIGLIQTYLSYEITLSVTAEEGGKPPFPDVTVCNLNPFWNNAEGWGLLAHIEGDPQPETYGSYILLLYRELHSASSTFESTNPELYSVSGYLKHTDYDEAMLEEMAKEFIWECTWEGNGEQNKCNIKPVVTPTNGLCYTIRPPEGEGISVDTRKEGLAVVLYLNKTNRSFVADYRLSPFVSYTEGVKVYLHPRGTAPEMTKGFTVAPGTEASVVAKYYRRKLMPAPYGHCRPKTLSSFDNFDADDVWNYTQYVCQSLCYQDEIINRCDCLDSTEITYEQLQSEHRFCSIFSLIDKQKALTEMNCSRQAKTDLDLNKTCSMLCPPPCEISYYDTSINQVPWPNDIYVLAFYYAYIRFRIPMDLVANYEAAVKYVLQMNISEAWDSLRDTDFVKDNFLQLSVTMDDTVVIEEDKPAITPEAIVGTMGGILNLYIGFNLITIADFLDLLLTLFIERIMAKKADVAKKKNAKSHKNKPKVTKVEPFRI